MAEECFSTISLLEQKLLMREKEILEAEEGKIEVRREFTKLLEERNYYEQRLKEANEHLRFKESELERLSVEKHDQEQRYSEILNVRPINNMGVNTIELAMQNSVDDARRFQ